SARRASADGGSSGNVWMPATTASVLRTRSCPAGGTRKAASSRRPSAPGCVASGWKKRAISLSSALSIPLSGRAREFLGPQFAGERIQHTIDEPGFVLVDEGVCNVDIFGDHDARGNVALAVEFEGAGAQDGAQQGLDALERPAFTQRLIDHRI